MKQYFLFFLITLLSSPLLSQDGKRISGPIIQDFGATFEVNNPDFPIDPNKQYKVLFDIYNSPADSSQINSSLNTLARFLNMHAQAGVPPENLHVACVIHNQASIAAMNDEAYQERFGIPNPNTPLLHALADAGANIYMCGQSIHARGLDRDRLAEPVQVALSAITVILSLEQDGYQLIRF